MEINQALLVDISRSVQCALQEDIGAGDLTAQLIAEDSTAKAAIVSRQAAILCGRSWVDEVYKRLHNDIQIEWRQNDGESLIPDEPFCFLSGPARVLLTGERVALNFLQLLSATATQTQQFVEKTNGTETRILDTRKTLRANKLQKRAAHVGFDWADVDGPFAKIDEEILEIHQALDQQEGEARLLHRYVCN